MRRMTEDIVLLKDRESVKELNVPSRNMKISKDDRNVFGSLSSSSEIFITPSDKRKVLNHCRVKECRVSSEKFFQVPGIKIG